METTKVTRLTYWNTKALRDHCGDLLAAQGETTATFRGGPGAAVVALQARIEQLAREHGRKGHPVASLHAVVRKLAAVPTPAADRDRVLEQLEDGYPVDAAGSFTTGAAHHLHYTQQEGRACDWCGVVQTFGAAVEAAPTVEHVCGWCSRADADCTRCRECGSHGSQVEGVCGVCSAVARVAHEVLETVTVQVQLEALEAQQAVVALEQVLASGEVDAAALLRQLLSAVRNGAIAAGVETSAALIRSEVTR